MVVVLLVGLGAFSLFELSGENAHVAELRDNWLPSVRSSLQMQAGLREIRLNEYRAAGSATPAEAQKAEPLIEAGLANYRHADAEYQKLMTEPEEKTAYADIQTLMPQYLDLDQQVRALAKAGKQADAMGLMTGQSATIRGAIEKDVKTIVDVNVAGAAREGATANQAYSRAIALVTGLIIAAAVVALGVALVIARGLAKQLGGEPRDAAALASDIAAGNLRVAVRLKAADRSSLMFSLGAMKDQLTSIVQGIQDLQRVDLGAREIARGNTDLSQRTEEQAASLQETASSMEQLTGTVKQNAENARQASHAGRQRVGYRDARRRSGRARSSTTMRRSRQFEQGRRHHRRDRRHRVPDQYPRAERGRGSGAGRRTGARFRGRRRRSAQPRAAQRQRREGDQGADRRLGRQGAKRLGAGRPRRARRWTRSCRR